MNTHDQPSATPPPAAAVRGAAGRGRAKLPLTAREEAESLVRAIVLTAIMIAITAFSHYKIGPWLGDAIGIPPHHLLRHVLAAAISGALIVLTMWHPIGHFRRKLAREGRI